MATSEPVRVGFIGLGVSDGHLRMHVADKAQASARDGADQLLSLAAVAQSLACGIDAAAQRRFGDDPAAPDQRNQIVLCDNPVAVFYQANQQIQHLRLDRNRLGPTAQLAQLGVQRMTRKRKLHFAVPGMSNAISFFKSGAIRAVVAATKAHGRVARPGFRCT